MTQVEDNFKTPAHIPGRSAVVFYLRMNVENTLELLWLRVLCRRMTLWSMSIKTQYHLTGFFLLLFGDFFFCCFFFTALIYLPTHYGCFSGGFSFHEPVNIVEAYHPSKVNLLFFLSLFLCALFPQNEYLEFPPKT